MNNKNMNIINNYELYKGDINICLTKEQTNIYDIFDIKTDRLNRPLKPLVSGKISVQTVSLISISILIMCVFFTTKLNQMTSDIVFYFVL